jgi:hypothetical protein
MLAVQCSAEGSKSSALVLTGDVPQVSGKE